ncbi:hypothetical protein C8R45DRAFT_1008028 [Mycena sanguinolenta]|nr:hypothetical protein C8R45DRAFT_1008028 [Mycena sanguinolenta]
MSRRIHLKSMVAPLLLTDLPADIIFSIFACCDIASVVSVAQTCRCLHAVAFEKSVWLVLLRNLRRRCILDRNCTPNLETLSTPEMIQVVKRLLNGPQTWSTAEPDSVAVGSKKITLHPEITPGEFPWSIVRLLPSGRYVLFTDSSKLKCWSVADDKLVWTHTSTIKDWQVHRFAAEEAETDVTIMLCICRNDRNYVEMVNLDLRTGTHTSLLIVRAPDYHNFLSSPAVCGAFAVVQMSMEWDDDGSLDDVPDVYLLINWRDRTYLILQTSNSDITLHVGLIPGYILLAQQGRRDQLRLISNDALSSYWAPATGIDGPAEFSPVPVEGIPTLSTFKDSDSRQYYGEFFSIHPSPIRDSDYFVWIYDKSNVYESALLSYRLSITNTGEPRWCKRTVRLEPSRWISAHAHGQSDIAPYSGALAYTIKPSIVIQYYK